VLAALTLATMPHFFFLAHQAITDMPFVGNMTMAMGLFIVALTSEKDSEAPRMRIGPVSLGAQHVAIAAVVLFALPQALYLISRNVTMVEGFLFAAHGDSFMYGSAGNHGIPGNAGLRDIQPYLSSWFAQPAAQGSLWLLGIVALIFFLSREGRTQGLAMFGFYFFCAMAFMGKGIPGFALPGLVAFFFLLAFACMAAALTLFTWAALIVICLVYVAVVIWAALIWYPQDQSK